jgi:hypothetical protein
MVISRFTRSSESADWARPRSIVLRSSVLPMLLQDQPNQTIATAWS